MRDVKWFKQEFESYLKGYEVEYKFFEKGDLGDLNQVEFNSMEKGGEIDFWSSGWLSVHFVDYINGNELLNILLKPEQYEEKDKILNQLKKLL
jgi:hypothetical protein